MEFEDFERAILEMVYEGGVKRITSSAVAYSLKIRSKEAEKKLEKMLQEGTLELDSDKDGRLFYIIPNAEIADLPNSETSKTSNYKRDENSPNSQNTNSSWNPNSQNTNSSWNQNSQNTNSSWNSSGSSTNSSWNQNSQNTTVGNWNGSTPLVPTKKQQTLAIIHGIMSFILPGLGQLVQGRTFEGVLYLIFGLLITPIFPLAIIIRFFAAFDAHKYALKTSPR